MLNSRVTVVVVLVAALAGISWASIETEPVKVTHRNSGPRYDVDDVERTKLTPDNSNENQVMPPRMSPERGNGGEQLFNNGDSPVLDNGEPAHIGRVSIRRIFLVPMMHHSPDSQGFWTGGASGPMATSGSSRAEEQEQPSPPVSMFGGANKPFWPFAPPSRHHLFGADQASRSPMAAEASNQAGEREEMPSNERPRPIMDPLQMMIDLMQQALSPQPAGNNFFNDLNKEASGAPSSSEKQDDTQSGSGGPLLGRPTMKSPESKNETKEEVVEIDGKKYLRKTEINRHIGENIIFMTKRLIFVPLNETDSGELTTTTTTVLPSSPTTTSEQEKRKEEPTTTTTTTTTTTAASTPIATDEATTGPANVASEIPSMPTSTSTTTTTTPASNKEETTPSSVADRISGMLEKIIESSSNERSDDKPETPKPSEAPKQL